MQLIAAMANVLVLAAALPPASRVELLPPPARIVLELEVQQWRRPHVERIRKPGTHTVELLCSHVPGKTALLAVEIEELAETPAGQPAWRECTPEELAGIAPTAEAQAVRFVDGIAAVEPRAAGTTLPGGVRAAHAFRTAGGALCLVPQDRAEALALASSAVPGDRLVIFGSLRTLPGGIAAVLVERVARPSDPLPPRTVRWDVTARWAGREAARFRVPGDYPLNLPCMHRADGVERVRLRLTEIKRVALNVQGHPVDAELADTAEKRSWGLQGRDGLGKNEGMLFFFPQADRPTFVMKTVSFPLSIAFIRADGVIVHIARLNPGDPRPAMPPVPVNYVLEMSQGWFAEHGVGPGSPVAIP